MIRLITPIPQRVCVAVSGGSDSMAALDFVVRGGREVRVLHFDHGTHPPAKFEIRVLLGEQAPID